MAAILWETAAVVAGVRIDYDIVSLLSSFVLITAVFGAIGGMAHHLVIVLQYRRPLLRSGDGPPPRRDEVGERPDYVDASLWAAGFVGAASAVGFVFFIIAMLGMESGFKAVMAVKVMSLRG